MTNSRDRAWTWRRSYLLTDEPMSTRVDGQSMRDIAQMVDAMLPSGVGFALLVYEHEEVGMSNYISNSQRGDMIKALRECANKLEAGMSFPTPENR